MKFLLTMLLILAVASGMPAEQQGQKEEVSRAVCPLVMCAIYCPTGHAVDDNGCTLCKCNSFATLKHICPLVMCALYCPDGFEIGETGCQTCRCNTGGIIAVDELSQ